MVIMTHPESFMLHKPKWAILCYHELCQTVCPPRKWNLPSTGLSPSRTHCLLASKCLVCQSSTPILASNFARHHSPRNHTPRISAVYPAIPQKVFISWNSKDFKIISARESGVYSLKKCWKWEKKSPTLPKSCKTWSSNKKTKFLSKCESISFLSHGHYTLHKIGIWLSSSPSWITIRLGNTGNQDMQHFPTHELHISALEVGKRGSKLRPHARIIHPERLESTIGKPELLLKNLAKIRARNLNEQQKTFRWRLFSPSTAQDQGMKTNTPYPPEP